MNLNITGMLNTTSVEITKNLLEILVIFIAGIWALYKINEFREFKHWMQFDIDANIYPMSKSNYIERGYYSWDKNGEREYKGQKRLTHVLEILFRFTNKGKTRVKIYNIQATIYTINSNMELDAEEGHLCLKDPISTGNIVGKNIKFYYIEPQVEQTISYLTLIEKPNDIIKIKGKFCLDEKRIYPKKEKGIKYFIDDKNEKYGLIGKEFLLIRIMNDYSARLCKFLKKRLIFYWDEIGENGKDNEKLKKYLIKNFKNMDFANKAKLKKADENTIEISDNGKTLLLRIIRKKNSNNIVLDINGVKLNHRLFSEIEHNEKEKIIIYERGRYDPIIGWIFRSIYNRYCRRLLSHSSEKTFFVDSEGIIKKESAQWTRSCAQENSFK